MIKLIKYILRHSRDIRIIGILLLVFMVIAQIPGYTYPVVIKDIINLMEANLDTTSDIHKKLWVVGILIAVQFFGWRAKEWLVMKYNVHVSNSILEECFSYVMKHSQAYINDSFV